MNVEVEHASALVGAYLYCFSFTHKLISSYLFLDMQYRTCRYILNFPRKTWISNKKFRSNQFWFRFHKTWNPTSQFFSYFPVLKSIVWNNPGMWSCSKLFTFLLLTYLLTSLSTRHWMHWKHYSNTSIIIEIIHSWSCNPNYD